MKEKVIRDVRIGVFAALLIVAIVFTVLAFQPESGPVEISGAFTVSSVPISLDEGTYEVFLDGTLRNKSDETVVIEKVEIEVEGLEKTPYAENVEIPARTEEIISGKTEKDKEVGKVKSVKITMDGKTRELRNPAARISLRRVFLPCFATRLFAALTVHAILMRIYWKQSLAGGSAASHGSTAV